MKLRLRLTLATVIVLAFQAATVLAAQPWTLEAAVDYALAHNPRARIALHRMDAANAVLGEASAAFMPSLQLRSGYMRTNNPMLAFGAILNQQAFSPALDFNNVPDTDDANVTGRVSVPLYAGGANVAGLRGAEANLAAADVERAAVANQLSFEVVRTLYSIVKSREFVRATEAGVRAFEKNLEVARNRLEAGTLLRTDVLDVEVRLARAREDLLQARNAEALAERALRNLLGIEEDDPGEFVVAGSVPALPPPASPDYRQRPELAAAAARVRAAEAALEQAQGGYLPRVDAFADAGYDRGWEFDNGAWNYTAGVALQWNLWDGNRTRSRVARARAELEQAREQRRQLELAIGLEVKQAQLQLDEARQRLTVSEHAVVSAAESAELTRSLFEQGLAISTQLIDAEAALIAVRVRRAEAEADLRIAIAALRKAVGLPQVPPSADSGDKRSAKIIGTRVATP